MNAESRGMRGGGDREDEALGPRISIEFHFSAHGTAEDLAHLVEMIHQADVYVPEAQGWSPKDKLELEAISRGELTPVQAGFKGKRLPEMEALYNSKKPILLIDTPKGHHTEKRYEESRTVADRAVNLFETGKFEQALLQAKRYAEARHYLLNQRDDHLRVQLQYQLQNLTGNFPQLREKPEIKVLVFLGAAHQAVYEMMERAGKYGVTAEFAGEQVFPTYIEIVRMRKEGEKKIPDIMYAKAVLEDFLSPFFRIIGVTDTNDVFRLSHHCLRDLTMVEAKGISLVLANAGREQYRALWTEFARLGKSLPLSKAEADEILKKYQDVSEEKQ